jgi:hypothetical protein
LTFAGSQNFITFAILHIIPLSTFSILPING